MARSFGSQSGLNEKLLPLPIIKSNTSINQNLKDKLGFSGPSQSASLTAPPKEEPRKASPSGRGGSRRLTERVYPTNQDLKGKLGFNCLFKLQFEFVGTGVGTLPCKSDGPRYVWDIRSFLVQITPINCRDRRPRRS